jgi:hypothetical protein
MLSRNPTQIGQSRKKIYSLFELVTLVIVDLSVHKTNRKTNSMVDGAIRIAYILDLFRYSMQVVNVCMYLCSYSMHLASYPPLK